MPNNSAVSFVLVVIVIFVRPAIGDDTPEAPFNFDSSAGRRLLEDAASVDRKVLEQLAKSNDAVPSLGENQPFTILILTTRIAETRYETLEFEHLTQNVTEFSKAILAGSEEMGCALKAKYIKNVTFVASASEAEGIVRFEAPGVFRGKVSFSARFAAGSWEIYRFGQIARNQCTVREKDGAWKIQPYFRTKVVNEKE